MATLALTLPSAFSSLGGVLPSAGVQAAPPVILADYIDTETRDFASMLSTLDPIDAQVVIAITTKRGSGAAVMDVGTKLHEIRKIKESVRTDIIAEIKTALSKLITNKDITLKPIEFTEILPGKQQISFMVSWVNLRAGTLPSIRALLSQG